MTIRLNVIFLSVRFSIQEVMQDSRTAFPFKGGELAAKR